MGALADRVRERQATRKPPQPAARLVLAPPPAEAPEQARAKVGAMLDAMADENERRAEWWKRPVSGWKAGRLEWTNAETGKEVAIHSKRPKDDP